MKKLTCCFTGHRDISKNEYAKIYEVTKIIIEILIKEKGILYFKVGGARGFDTIVALAIIELKVKYQDIKLILILPCKNQCFKWNKRDIDLYNLVLESADEIIYISENYTKTCMLERNDELLENSNYCVCYLREKIMQGGTFYTVSRAKKNNIEIYNVNNYI